MLNHFLLLNRSLRARFEARTAWLGDTQPVVGVAGGTRSEMVLALLLAVVTTYIAHYFFEPRLSVGEALYSEEVFRAQYYSGIFAYRVLGRELVLLLNRNLFAGSNLYASRAVLNLAALLCFNVVYLQLLRRFRVAPRDRLSSVFMVDALTLMSLSVNSNPYTVLSLALIYGAIYCAETGRPAGVLVTLVLGTLAHDANVLILVYWMLQTLFGRYDSRPEARRRLAWTGALTAGWLLTYGLLRVLVPRAEASLFWQWITGATSGVSIKAVLVSAAFLFAHSFAGPRANFTAGAFVVVVFIGTLYGIFFTRDALVRARAWPHVPVFLLLVVPYYLWLSLVALLVEVRLFLPFFPCLVMIGRIGASDESRVPDVAR
jgi:hypothetical protein